MPGQAAHSRSFDKPGSPAGGCARRGGGTATCPMTFPGELTVGPREPALLAVGDVRMVEEEMNPYVIS